MKSAPLTASDARGVGVKIADALADARARRIAPRRQAGEYPDHPVW
jgi:hypothetical protein